MRLSSPAFWYPDSESGKTCRISELSLAPIASLYQFAHKINYASKSPYHASVPVICIGNITMGGSGKTPVAISIMELVKSLGFAQNPAFLSRGYGGLNTHPALIDLELYDYTDVGDEAILLAAHGPTVTAKKRGRGAKYAERKGFDALIMDDGLQNNTLAKTLSFCVIDGKTGFGNGKTFPAGPLREPPREGLAKCDAVIIIGEDRQNIAATIPADKPVFNAHIIVSDVPDKTANYVAFAGIGHPEKFKATLESLGLKLTDFIPFPDHHSFTENDLDKLAQAAKTHNAALLTTEKDMTRLPRNFIENNNVKALPIKIEWQDRAALEAFLKQSFPRQKAA